MQVTKTIDLLTLKHFVARTFSDDSILKELIRSERDHLSPREYCDKVKIWLKLLEIENKGQKINLRRNLI